MFIFEICFIIIGYNEEYNEIFRYIEEYNDIFRDNVAKITYFFVKLKIITGNETRIHYNFIKFN